VNAPGRIVAACIALGSLLAACGAGDDLVEPGTVGLTSAANAAARVQTTRAPALPPRPEPAARTTARIDAAGNDGSAPDLFAAHTWYVPPPPPPVRPPEKVKPTPPPLPYTLLGTYEPGDDPTVFLLSRGDAVFDARVGDVLEQNWRLDSYENGELTVTYLPLNVQQVVTNSGGAR
jgi:hypothetical protein